MALIYITGISGTGKTAVAAALKAHGHEAYDADGEGFNSWYDRKTNKKVKVPEGVNPHTREWQEKNIWNMSREKMEELAAKAKNKTIFFCGVTANEREMWDLFSKVICLTADEKTLRHRLATRMSNDYGKAPHELEDILRWHKPNQEAHRQSGAIIIDTIKPLDEVVEEILILASSCYSTERQ